MAPCTDVFVQVLSASTWSIYKTFTKCKFFHCLTISYIFVYCPVCCELFSFSGGANSYARLFLSFWNVYTFGYEVRRPIWSVLSFLTNSLVRLSFENFHNHFFKQRPTKFRTTICESRIALFHEGLELTTPSAGSRQQLIA